MRDSIVYYKGQKQKELRMGMILKLNPLSHIGKNRVREYGICWYVSAILTKSVLITPMGCIGAPRNYQYCRRLDLPEDSDFTFVITSCRVEDAE